MKRTFEQFLQIIHNIGFAEYLELNPAQQKALDCQYKDMYR